MALQDDATPIPIALPELPLFDFFNEIQWDVLNALVDAVVPSITPESSVKEKTAQIVVGDDEFKAMLERTLKSLSPSKHVDEASVRGFLLERPSENPVFVENLMRSLANVPPSAQQKLAGFLSMMSTRIGSLIITGYWEPIYTQPAAIRESILKSWINSRTTILRTLAKLITGLALKANCQTNTVLHKLAGYTDIPRDWKAVKGYDFQFLQFEASESVETIETDVVIVGSGCGGGVCAKNLAEAGHRVLVVDKGYHFSPDQLPMNQEAACSYLYDNRGVYVTEDNGCMMAVGALWGGGGSINWSVCLKLQDYVRQEWADEGLPFFTSDDFEQSFDRVWDFVGADTSGIRHNHRNKVLLNGCKRLGWRAGEAPQNTAGKEHYCGQCHLGCGSGEKRGPAVSWLPAAADAGAEFIEGLQVDKVLFAEDGESAIGIEGSWVSRDAAGGVSGPVSERTKRRLIIKAKKVVLSAGSLWSPLLLEKSGVKNWYVGRNLHIHPCNMVTAVYKDEVRPWEGGIITSYSSEFENIDEKGHGVKLEPTCMIPYTILSMLPWTNGLDAKLMMLKYPYLSGFIALTRDRDSGRVFSDPTTGRPRIDYTVSDYDRDHTLEGVQALSKLCYVTGATEIRPLLPGLEPFISTQGSTTNTLDMQSATHDPETSDPAFAAWLSRLREVGNKPPVATWSSAHLMGTCRMSANRENGVVDARGKVWGRENLYVADASVFPSASGVNPMITVMTIADWISRSLDKELRASE